MEGWKEYRLDDIANVIMGLSPKGDTYNNDGRGIPLLNGPTEFGESHPECTLFTNDPKRVCKKGDLIFCVRGSTTGRMNWADQPYALGRGVCSITGVDDLTTKFIKHLLSLNLSALLKITGGGTFPNLRKEDINGFKFSISDNYRKIASILSAYDDLIENNLKRIKLLEEKAQLTYEEWFVRMKFPGHETARFDEETGLPEGWEKVRLKEIADFKYGKMPKKERIVDQGYPIYSGYRVTGNYQEVMFSEPTLIVVARGVGGTGDVKLTPRNCWLTNLSIAVLPNENTTRNYLFYLLKDSNLRMLDSGAAQSQITITSLENIQINHACLEKQRVFNDIIDTLFCSIENIKSQIELLKEARDILLPRLMSGMIDVEELDVNTQVA